MDLAAVILAAGKSTRMKSALPKAVHPICGKPMTRYVIDACLEADIRQIVVVVGHAADQVKTALGSDVRYAIQEQQLGTGHATMQAMPHVTAEQVIILPGDSPLMRAETVRSITRSHTGDGAAATLLTAVLDDPASYGRIVRGPDDCVERIVEARDATPDVLAIGEVATSAYCFRADLLREALSELRTDNAQGEYYLTDTVAILRRKGHRIDAVIADDWRDTLGINTRVELAEAAGLMKGRLLEALMLDGVTIVSPETTFVDAGVTVGRDSVIHPCTTIEGKTVIGEGCAIGPFARLVDAAIGDGARVVASTVVGVRVQNGGTVGPYENASCACEE